MFAPLNGGQVPNGAPTVLGPPGAKQLSILPATMNNPPASGQIFWTIERVDGHISISSNTGPHKRTLKMSDEEEEQHLTVSGQTEQPQNNGLG